MKISYILPITNDAGPRLTETSCAIKYVAETFESILTQSIPNWELIVVYQKGLRRAVIDAFNTAANQKYLRDTRRPDKINVVFKEINSRNSAKACNKGLELSKGSYISIIQAGDKLAETTSYELIKCIFENPKTQFIYSDHDYIDARGYRFGPSFKPRFSPDLLYCKNYIGNLTLIKKTLLKKIGFSEKFGAAYDYFLYLNATHLLRKFSHHNYRICGKKSQVNHISRILYHQRVNVKINPRRNKLPAIKAIDKIEKRQSKQGLSALRIFFDLQKKNVQVSEIESKIFRHEWAIPKPEPLVSLIIPTRDGYEILKNCIDSILNKTKYTNYEILIIDNQSTERKTVEYLNNLENKFVNIKVFKYNKKFNYSAINNYAAKHAAGQVLGLINNDTEVINSEWLTEMVSHALRPEIGCVGALLYYPDDSIQHAGVEVGENCIPRNITEYNLTMGTDRLNMKRLINNPIAVTGAALFIKKNIFDKLGGFNAVDLKIIFNDVDICLRCNELNIFNVFTPYAKLVHHESATRKRQGEMNSVLHNQEIKDSQRMGKLWKLH